MEALTARLGLSSFRARVTTPYTAQVEKMENKITRTAMVVQNELFALHGEAHGADCAQRCHSAAECTCGKADRINELEDELEKLLPEGV